MADYHIPDDNPYNQDGLGSIHNHDFMVEPSFVRAYRRGVKASADDYGWHWRVHVGLWAASVASKLDGDFVECGVNRGFMSSAIMELLYWNTQNRRFFLLDTFKGVDLKYASQQEIAGGIANRNAADIQRGFYTFDVNKVRDNFSEWKNVVIIEGSVPETLSQIDTQKVAFAHMDMNCTNPEIAAMEFLWDRLVPGAPVLCDDYGYVGYYPQKVGIDQFARKHNVSVLTLPTGQGLIIKPPR